MGFSGIPLICKECSSSNKAFPLSGGVLLSVEQLALKEKKNVL